MSTLTVRIEEGLKKKAAEQARAMGIPLTLVVKSALVNFINSPKLIIGKAETVVVDKGIQSKMDEVGKLLS